MQSPYNASTLIDANLISGRGDATAILSGKTRITYKSLLDQVSSMGRALGELGTNREDRVLLILNDTPAFPVSFFGAMRIGAIPVPVNPLYKTDDYRFFVEDSYARVLIVEASNLDKVRKALEGYDQKIVIIVSDGDVEGCLSFDDLLKTHLRDVHLPPLDTHADDMAFWLYSSGSTGKPKGVVHLHRDIPATCDTYARHVLRLTKDDIVFGRVLFHAYGLGNSLTFPFDAGATTVLAPGRATPASIIDVIETHRPTVLCLVPTLYNALLHHVQEMSNAVPDLSTIRLCISAAEPLAPDVARRWKHTFGHTILDGIGSTEMLHIFCSNTPDAWRAGSSGKPVPGYELRILDDEGKPVADGSTGNLFVKGESAAPFYWHNQEKSRATMQGEWTATGDRYRVDEDGFYWYEGRADDMLKVGGEWVSPIEMENVLMEHHAVQEAAVVGVMRDGVTRLKAVIVLANGIESLPPLITELQDWCKTRLQRFRYPHIIQFVDDLPKTATGKIQRFKLRELP